MTNHVNFFFFFLSKYELILFVFFFLFQKLKYKKSLRDIDGQSIWRNECKKYLSLGRNAIVVIFGTLLAYILNVYDKHPFSLTGKNDSRIALITKETNHMYFDR